MQRIRTRGFRWFMVLALTALLMVAWARAEESVRETEYVLRVIIRRLKDTVRHSKSSTNKDAIRGRAQQVLDANGGARSRRNLWQCDRGDRREEPRKTQYLKAAVREFGEILRKFF